MTRVIFTILGILLFFIILFLIHPLVGLVQLALTVGITIYDLKKNK